MSGTTCAGGDSCTCGCCGGAVDLTPERVANRPGLSTVAHRTGTHPDFLASMIAGLDGPEREALRALTTRDLDDVTIGLLDAWAVSADVLTFYTERLAQESFLRTATERVSLQELGRLIGSRLRPGVAAETALAFALEPPPPTPALPPGSAPQPGSSPPVTPAVVTIPERLRVQSIPGPGEAPQSFETVEAIDARPEWGAIPASTTTAGIGATEAWVRGVGLNLKPGDLVRWKSPGGSVARYLTAVVDDAPNDRTRIVWTEPLASVTPTPDLSVFRATLAAFGHNAPMWNSLSEEFQDQYEGPPPIDFEPGPDVVIDIDLFQFGPFRSDWPDFPMTIGPSIAALIIDGGHPEITTGSSLHIQSEDGQGFWNVDTVTIGSHAQFAVSGRATTVKLSNGVDLGSTTPRRLVIHAAPESLELARQVDTSRVTGPIVEVEESTVEALAAGRRVIVTGTAPDGAAVVHVTTVDAVEKGTAPTAPATSAVPTGGPALGLLDLLASSGMLSEGFSGAFSGATSTAWTSAAWYLPASSNSLVNAFSRARFERFGAGDTVFQPPPSTEQSNQAGRWLLHLHEALPTDLVRTSVVVNANVALATHGETVSELAGSGRASATHQRFTLRRDPLTQVQSSDPSGTTPALEVRVNDVEWKEVPTLYGAEPSDTTFARRVDEDGHTYIQFGDGVHGSRLPTGSQNVRLRYRTGLGQAGNVGADQLATLLDRPLGLKGVTNPAGATGGVDPEPATAARRSIPLAVKTLGRAVSVLDYEDFARSFAGVSKAQAVVLTLPSGPTVVVTVAFGDDGTDPVGERTSDLLTSFRDHGDPHVPVEVLDHVQVAFRLALTVAVDPAHEPDAVVAGVDGAIRGSFAFGEREFGSSVERSQVITVAQNVPGVVAVDLDRLYVGTGGELASRLVAPAAAVTAGGVVTPAGILVAAPAPFDWLEVMT